MNTQKQEKCNRKKTQYYHEVYEDKLFSNSRTVLMTLSITEGTLQFDG